MPLHLDIFVHQNSRLLVWKVTEPLDLLKSEIILNESNQVRVTCMKSELHQRAFLSVRKLLAIAGYSDFDLYYDEFGKPHLNSEKHISISHSHNFAAVIISDKTVGIDLEWAREKIIRIADKFASGEMHFLLPKNKQDYIEKLTVIWGVKESIFKIRNEPGISFKHHITVLPFEMEDQEAVGQLHFGTSNVDFDIHFLIIEDFVLVYAFESAHK